MIQMILSMNPIGQLIIGVIVLILLFTIVALLRVKAKYLGLIFDMTEHENRKNIVFKSEINNAIVDDFKSAQSLKIQEINTPAIIDKNINQFLSKTLLAERFAQRSSALMIVLGLVGTFFGLTLSISELVALLSNTNEAIIGDVNMITGGLLSSINGMSVAFVTSLFGITASIIVNLLTILIGIHETRESYIAVVEEYLDNVLGLKIQDLTHTDENGKTPLENAFEALGEQLTKSLDDVSQQMSYRLTVASSNMKDTAETIEKSLNTFDQSIQTFSQNTRDFSEFNHHLKTNIQRMSVAFEDLTDGIKASRK